MIPTTHTVKSMFTSEMHQESQLRLGGLFQAQTESVWVAISPLSCTTGKQTCLQQQHTGSFLAQEQQQSMEKSTSMTVVSPTSRVSET